MSSWSIVLFTNLKPNTSIDAWHLRMTMSVKLMYNYDNTVSFMNMYLMKKFLSIDSLSDLIWNPSEWRSMMLTPVLEMHYCQNILHCSCILFWGTWLTLCLRQEISLVTRRMQIKRPRVQKHIEKYWENDRRNSPFTKSEKSIYLYYIFASNTQEANFPFQRLHAWENREPYI